MQSVTITYHGHSCFCLESEGYRTVVDPYEHGMIPGLPNLELHANAVYCSHDHGDHGFAQAVTIHETDEAVPYTLSETVTPHDDQGGALRGMNTVRIFDFGGLTVAHLGDIGCFPDDKLLSKLKGVDCLLIPVGGFFTIDSEIAKKIVDAVNPRVCIPMHYRTDCSGFDLIAHLNDFKQYFSDVNTRVNSVTLTNETPKQILVLQYKP